MLRQDPDAGEEAATEDTVKLIVSAGPGKVRVPSVRNTPLELAIRELEKQGLEVTADPQPSGSVRKGFAIGTSPRRARRSSAGRACACSSARGRRRIEVPDVVGLTREAAETRLTREGSSPTWSSAHSDRRRTR